MENLKEIKDLALIERTLEEKEKIYDQLAEAGARWWLADADGAVFDNGDNNPILTLLANELYGDQKGDQRKKEKFVEVCKDYIKTELYRIGEISFHADYGAEWRLSEICREAGFYPVFSWKTSMYIDKNCIEIAKGHGAESKTIFVADQENYEIGKELSRRIREQRVQEDAEKQETGKKELEAFVEATGKEVVKNFVNAYGDMCFLRGVYEHIVQVHIRKGIKDAALSMVYEDREKAQACMESATKEMSYAGAQYLLAYDKNLGDKPVRYLARDRSEGPIVKKADWYIGKAGGPEDNTPISAI